MNDNERGLLVYISTVQKAPIRLRYMYDPRYVYSGLVGARGSMLTQTIQY